MTRFEKIKRLDPVALAEYLVDNIDCWMCKEKKMALAWLAQLEEDEDDDAEQ